MSSQPRSTLKQILIAAMIYFALVFGAGSIFGPIRILLISPRIGERAAELIEAPLMLIVIIIAARWVVRRVRVSGKSRLVVGMLALTLVLLLEFTVVLSLRGLTLTEYFQTRDPVSESVYYMTLALFAVMPFLVGSKGAQASAHY